MAGAVIRLPDHQIAPLADAYRQSVAARRMRGLLFGVVIVAMTVAASWAAEVRLDTLWAKFGNFTSYFARLAYLDTGAPVWTDPVEWFWGLGKWSSLLGETLLMAYVGTLLGAALAFCLCFLCSEKLVGSAAVRFATRRFLELCRTVPEIVFALLFVVAFGLGPLPGVLAIIIHTTGALGKLFSEVVDNIDQKPLEGVRAAGANWVQTVRFAAVPQVLANFASYALLRFEINVRGAAVLGFVGAGGIGQDLLEAIRKFYYSDVSAILVMIVATVYVLDLLTEQLRHRLTDARREA